MTTALICAGVFVSAVVWIAVDTAIAVAIYMAGDG